MEVPNSKTGVSLRAYQGDAMTLLAFDLDESQTKNFAGFSIRITAGTRKPYGERDSPAPRSFVYCPSHD